MILGASRNDLLNINPFLINELLTADELLYILKTLDGYWTYNYEAAKLGNVGLHARLKSLNHSDQFLYSKAALRHDVICQLMARQLKMLWNHSKPDWIAGIPDGATTLGQMTGMLMGVKVANLVKENRVIKCLTKLRAGDTVLLVEDFCTKGTGLKEAVLDIKLKNPEVVFIRKELVLLNRGGLTHVSVPDMGDFEILSLIKHCINDWLPEECPMCRDFKSDVIEPKSKPENWDIIRHSQD